MMSYGAQLNALNRWGKMPLQGALMAKAPHAITQRLTISCVHVMAAGASGRRFEDSAAVHNSVLTAEPLGLTQQRVHKVQASWSWLASSAYPEREQEQLEEYGAKLLLNLFKFDPGSARLFSFTDEEGKPNMPELRGHGLKVAKTLGVVVTGLDNVDALAPVLADLVRRHITYGVKMEQFVVIANVMLTTLEEALDVRWEQDVRVAWTAVLGVLLKVAEGVYGEELVA